jgi:hypothetical protein
MEMPRTATAAEVEKAIEEMRLASDSLRTLLDRATAIMASPTHWPDGDIDGPAALMSLFRIIVAHARAILSLAPTDFAEASTSNLRTIFEAWLEVQHIAIQANKAESAARFCIFGLLEMKKSLVAHGATSTTLASLDATILRYRTKYVVAFSETEQLKGNFWTGSGRKKQIEQFQSANADLIKRRTDAMILAGGLTVPSGGKVPDLIYTYKVLSWDSHSVLAAAIGTELDDAAQTFHYTPFMLQPEFGASNCALAAGLVSDAWRCIATAYGLTISL